MARRISGEKVEESDGGGFDPLPAGKYLAYVFEVDVREYGPQSKNAGRENYNIQYKIAEDQPYANRRVFDTVGLFTKWSSGSDNFRFFQFFAAVEGISSVELRKKYNADGGIDIPEPQDLEGKLVTIDLGVRENTYNGVTSKQNTVKNVTVASGADNNVTPTKVSSTVVELEL